VPLSRRLLHFIVASAVLVLPSVASASAASGGDGDDGRGVGPLIVGGDSVAISDVPWQASILQAHLDPADDDGFFDQFCGGAVIAATWIVTAAHCVFDVDGIALRPADIEVASGYAQLSAVPSFARRAVARIVVHPDYDPAGFDVDIALLELSSAVPLADGTVEVIDVFDEVIRGSGPAAGTSVQVSGWGCTALLGPFDDCPGDAYADELQAVDLQVINDPDSTLCGAVTGVNAATMICAGRSDLSGGQDSCVGDSGGPLVAGADSDPVLVGLVSWGEGCAQAGSPGVYTRISAFTEWIGLYVGEASTPPAPSGDGFTAIEGARPVNTRDDADIPKQGATKGYGDPLRVNVGALDAIPADAAAVAVNITATGAEEWGFVAAYPCGSEDPTEWPGNSNVNFDAGATVANSAIVPLNDGYMCLVTYGKSDVIVDVSGYFAGGFTPIDGERPVNTRDSDTPKQGATEGYGVPLRVDVGALEAIPADAAAVAVNITATGAEEWGFVAAYPCASDRFTEWPGNSNVNFDTGATVANSAIVPLDDGHMCLVTYGKSDVIVDVSGYFDDGFTPIDGARPVNTRDSDTPKQGATEGYGVPLRVNVGALDAIPADAAAVAVNITATGAEEWGFIAAYPCASSNLVEWPGNSNVNFDTGATVANSAIVPLNDGHMCLVTYGKSDVIVDVVGYTD